MTIELPPVATFREALARAIEAGSTGDDANFQALANVVHSHGLYLQTLAMLFAQHERRCQERHEELMQRFTDHLQAHEAGGR